MLVLQPAFSFFFGFVLGAFLEGVINQSEICIHPHPYALCSGNSSPLECDAVHIWVKAGAEKPSSEVATPSLLDRAGLGSSLALKQSWFGTTNNGPKAQTELARMAF